MSSVLPSTGNATDSSEDTKICEPCVVRRLSVALPVSLITGYTDPIAAAACSGRSACCGGIANLTMRKCRKRSRGKHTFGTAQDSRQVCLFHLETRGHAENILVPKEPPAMHAPVLHFARLRYDTPLNHATCASALLKIATPRTDPSKPHRIAPNDFDLIVEWLNTQNGEDTHRHRISQVGISDKRSAITLNQVGRHNKRNRKVTCRFPTRFSERVGHQVIVFGGRSVLAVSLRSG